MLLLGSTGLPLGATIGAQACNATTVCAAQDAARAAGDPLAAADVASACSGERLTLVWNVTTADIGREVQLCAVAKDTSSLCYGQGPPDATAVGWYGRERCAAFRVASAAFEWQDYSAGASFDAYVGCAFTFRVGLVQSTPGYPAVFEATVMPAGAAARQECVVCGGAGGASVTGIIEWSPPRGSEGLRFAFCYRGSDGLATVTAERCFNVTVGKCRCCFWERGAVA